jgi:ABC-type multidrug transport system fused ATPase/permease subunit
MVNNIKIIFKILDQYQKKNFYILIFLMFISMVLEILGIASLIPVINFFLKNDLIFYEEYINKIYLLNNFSQFKIISLVFFFLTFFFIIKSSYLLFYYWFESKIIYKIRYELGFKLFKKYINNPYFYHVENNSSNLLSKIIQQTPAYGSSVMSLANIFSNSILLLGIFIFLFIIRPIETFFTALAISSLSIIFFFLIKKNTFNVGKKTEVIEKQRIKLLQESFGAIKEVNIYNVQNQFTFIFKKLSDEVAKNAFMQMFYMKIPKIWFEMIIVFTTFLLLFFNLLYDFDNKKILITISIFLISSIKVLPSISVILNSFQNIKFHENSLTTILEDIKIYKQEQTNIKNNNIIMFKDEIKFSNVSFHYPNSDKFIIKDCNIIIKKNDFVCILGETGSGKSTFVDLLTSLISPINGKILVDNVDIVKNIYSWKDKISYVPQEPFLLDTSIRENIIFHNNQNYSEERLIDSVHKSELKNLINKIPKGIDSIVGEKGIKISGGERQRISIARAIYRESEVIVFDESTNSLDLETEKKIMSTIFKFKGIKTIIFVTHKNNFLSMFDRIFKLENNKIREV